jgi:hypothetical protein
MIYCEKNKNLFFIQEKENEIIKMKVLKFHHFDFDISLIEDS